MAVTNKKDAEKKDREMGRKQIVPYALYRMEGYVSAAFAEKTGFGPGDLQLLWDALVNMFEHDHSAARGKMAARKLLVFEHSTKLGNAPAHKLFDCVTVARKDTDAPPRRFQDYDIAVDSASLPAEVKLIEVI